MSDKENPRVIWQNIDFEDFPRRWVEAKHYESVKAERNRYRDALEILRRYHGGDGTVTREQVMQALNGGDSDQPSKESEG